LILVTNKLKVITYSLYMLDLSLATSSKGLKAITLVFKDKITLGLNFRDQ